MKILIAAVAAIAGLIFVVNQGSAFISDIRSQISGLPSQVTDLLPGGDARELGVAEGEKLLNNSSYLDEMNIALLPGASELIASIKNGQITQERITQLAELYFPVAALQAGILDISAENRAEFVKGVIEGYFPQ
jgi:hypothetical protein